MRTCWTAAATLALIAAADPPPVRSQVLDLPMVVEPPPLDASSYPAALIGTLEDEIARLIGAEPGTVGSARLVNRASINVRLIAADLRGAGETVRYSVERHTGDPAHTRCRQTIFDIESADERQIDIDFSFTS